MTGLHHLCTVGTRLDISGRFSSTRFMRRIEAIRLEEARSAANASQATYAYLPQPQALCFRMRSTA